MFGFPCIYQIKFNVFFDIGNNFDNLKFQYFDINNFVDNLKSAYKSAFDKTNCYTVEHCFGHTPLDGPLFRFTYFTFLTSEGSFIAPFD